MNIKYLSYHVLIISLYILYLDCQSTQSDLSSPEKTFEAIKTAAQLNNLEMFFECYDYEYVAIAANKDVKTVKRKLLTEKIDEVEQTLEYWQKKIDQYNIAMISETNITTEQKKISFKLTPKEDVSTGLYAIESWVFVKRNGRWKFSPLLTEDIFGRPLFCFR